MNDYPMNEQCTAKSKRTGKRCKLAPAKGKAVCRFHGGKSLSGKDSPLMKHGRYSKNLPDKLAQKYLEAQADPALLDMRSDIALVDTRLAEMTGTITEDNAADHWKEILTLLEQRRKLVESERKRLVEMHQVITAERAMVLMSAILGIIRENVNDRETLTRISEGIRRIVD